MKNKIIFVVIVLIILAGFGFYLYNNDKNPAIQGQSLDKSMNTVNIGGVIIQGEGDMKGFKIEPIEIPKNKPVINVPLPNLDMEIKITVRNERRR